MPEFPVKRSHNEDGGGIGLIQGREGTHIHIHNDYSKAVCLALSASDYRLSSVYLSSPEQKTNNSNAWRFPPAIFFLAGLRRVSLTWTVF